MKAEKIFNYSKHPFEFQSFALTMETGVKAMPRKTVCLYIGIRPIILAVTTATDYSITIELKLWKTSLAFNIILPV